MNDIFLLVFSTSIYALTYIDWLLVQFACSQLQRNGLDSPNLREEAKNTIALFGKKIQRLEHQRAYSREYVCVPEQLYHKCYRLNCPTDTSVKDLVEDGNQSLGSFARGLHIRGMAVLTKSRDIFDRNPLGMLELVAQQHSVEEVGAHPLQFVAL